MSLKVKSPKIEVGKHVVTIFRNGDKIETIEGEIIANNTIDFMTLEALYTMN